MCADAPESITQSSIQFVFATKDIDASNNLLDGLLCFDGHLSAKCPLPSHSQHRIDERSRCFDFDCSSGCFCCLFETRAIAPSPFEFSWRISCNKFVRTKFVLISSTHLRESWVHDQWSVVVGQTTQHYLCHNVVRDFGTGWFQFLLRCGHFTHIIFHWFTII